MPERIHDIMYKFAQQIRSIFGDSLKKVVVYGSYARGDYQKNSDIDIMILVDADDVEIAESTYHMAGLCFENQVYRDVVNHPYQALSMLCEQCWHQEQILNATRMWWHILTNIMQLQRNLSVRWENALGD